jgi:hypothetical protein
MMEDTPGIAGSRKKMYILTVAVKTPVPLLKFQIK